MPGAIWGKQYHQKKQSYLSQRKFPFSDQEYTKYQGSCRTADGGKGTNEQTDGLANREACQALCDNNAACVAYEWEEGEGSTGASECEIHTDTITSGSGEDNECYVKKGNNFFS